MQPGDTSVAHTARRLHHAEMQWQTHRRDIAKGGSGQDYDMSQTGWCAVRRVTFLATFALMWLHARHTGVALAIVVWATATALSRCLMGRHYLGDVLAGNVTGVATAATLSKVSPV